jgi:hypothetical protein
MSDQDDELKLKAELRNVGLNLLKAAGVALAVPEEVVEQAPEPLKATDDESAKPIGEALRDAVAPVLDREARKVEVAARKQAEIREQFLFNKRLRQIEKLGKRLARGPKKGKRS